MTNQLQNKDYSTFKSQIHLLKQFYSKQKKMKMYLMFIIEQQIKNLFKNTQNNKFESRYQYIKTIGSGSDQIQLSAKFDYDHQNGGQCLQQLIEMALCLKTKYNDKVILTHFDVYILAFLTNMILFGIIRQLAIRYYYLGNALKIQINIKKQFNPKYDDAWNNKSNQLLDSTILGNALSPNLDSFRVKQLNATTKLFHQSKMIMLGVIKASNQFLMTTIDYYILYKIQRCYIMIKSCPLALLLQNYNEKLIHYKLLNEIFTLFEFGNKQEAREVYLDALQNGSNQKDYIQKQLSKL